MAITKVNEAYQEAMPAGIQFKLTGPAGFSSDLNKAFAGIDGILLLTALAVVFVILIFVYRSVILPVLVLLTSIFALSASIVLVYYLAKAGVLDLNGQVQGILFILVIGAATDYSLLYVARYREMLHENSSKFEATIEAWKGTVEPILASGGTVIVGILVLLMSDLSSNKALAPVGSIGIGFAMLSALTFLPSVLYAVGRSSFWPSVPKSGKVALLAHKQKLKRGFWHNLGEFVSKRYRSIWTSTVAILLIAALGITQLKADGVPQSELILGQSDAKDGQEILSENFPGGSGSPAEIVLNQSSIESAAKVLDATEGVDGVAALATNDPGFVPLGERANQIRSDIKDQIKKERPKQAQTGMPSVEELVDKAYPFKQKDIKTIEQRVVLQATMSDAQIAMRPKTQYSECEVMLNK